MTRKTVEIVAPGNLPEGYIFDATVDGITFPVTVPAGGVEQGQTMQVPYPSFSSSTYSSTTPVFAVAEPISDSPVTSCVVHPNGTRVTETKHPDGTTTAVRETVRIDNGSERRPLAAMGRFRNGMCDCCEVFCSARFWMALCCIGCYMGQVMQRFKLNPCGAHGNYNHTCQIASLAFTILVIVSLILTGVANYNLRIIITIWMTIAITLTHREYRKKYFIPPKCCGESCWGDCCCAFWCGCCLAIQMDRHTHDEAVYKYDCFSETGLSKSAPEIV